MLTVEELSYILRISPEKCQQLLRKSLKSLSSRKGPIKKVSHQDVKTFLERQGLGHKKQLITIAALKGGIGKTFLSTTIAARFSMFGAKVLIIDLDPEACATNSLISEEEIALQQRYTIYEVLKNLCPIDKAIIPTRYTGLDLLPSSLRVSKCEKIINGKNPKTLIKKFIDKLNYDYIFFELPPSFSTLSSSAYLASDQIIIPCTPNIHALESVDLTIEAVNEVANEFECHQIQFKVILNRFNSFRNASQDVLNILKDDHPKILLPFQIRESAEIQNAINAGLTIYETKSSKQLRKELDQLMEAISPLTIRATTYTDQNSENQLQDNQVGQESIDRPAFLQSFTAQTPRLTQ